MGRDVAGPLRAAVALLAVQGAGLVVVGVFLIVRGFGRDASDLAGAELGGALAVLGGVGLVLLARAHAHRRSWARSPTIVVEIICVPVAVGLLQGGRPAYGIPLLVIAVGSLVLLAAAGALGPPERD